MKKKILSYKTRQRLASVILWTVGTVVALLVLTWVVAMALRFPLVLLVMAAVVVGIMVLFWALEVKFDG